MTFDYDLVIIGDSPAAVTAAITAAGLKARIALVQSRGEAFRYEDYCFSPDIFDQNASPVQASAPNHQIITNYLATTVGEESSPAVLAAMGIDVIYGSGEFRPKPQLAFEVGNRLVRSRRYLLTPHHLPAIPPIEGLTNTTYYTHHSIHALKDQKTPQSLIIIGSDPIGIQWAQILAWIGTRVTVITASPHILPQEDPEASQLLQAQLEADGIRILTNTTVTQVKEIENKKWVQAGNQAIDADEIFLATGYQPDIQNLNLERAGVEIAPNISINPNLQTVNPRIYICGELLGKYPQLHIANYEAKIAVKNALFWPVFKCDYRPIPSVILSNPQLARIGLTETEARGRYGDDILVFQQYFKSLVLAQLRDETTGFCKIIASRRGEILGVHIIGPDARELINTFALAMQRGLKVQDIASLNPILPSLSEIIPTTAQLWHQHRRRRWHSFLEAFFNWRRG
ncbi:MAG: mercury(II) reductase [Oscillatoriaceae cyanobacterium]